MRQGGQYIATQKRQEQSVSERVGWPLEVNGNAIYTFAMK